MHKVFFIAAVFLLTSVPTGHVQTRAGYTAPTSRTNTQRVLKPKTLQQNNSYRGGRQAPAAPKVEVNSDCAEIIAWTQQVEDAYPDVDFRGRAYFQMSDLFKDELFVPVFGRSFKGMSEPERTVLWNKIRPCFAPQKPVDVYQWQRMELARAFKDKNLQYNYFMVLEHLAQKQGNKDWISNLDSQLASLSIKDDEQEMLDITKEGWVRIIGLPKEEQDAFFEVLDQYGLGFEDHNISPNATHMAHPGFNDTIDLQPIASIVNYADSYGNLSGELSRCDRARAGDIKRQYLMNVNRIYPSGLDEARDKFDSSFSRHSKKKAVDPGCDFIEKKIHSRIYTHMDRFDVAVASDARGNPLGPQGKLAGRPFGFVPIVFDQSKISKAPAYSNDDPGYFDTELFTKIKGEHEEINDLGRFFKALQAGAIWFKKFNARYGDRTNPQDLLAMNSFAKRRDLDISESKDQIRARVTNQDLSEEEFNLFLKQHLSVFGDIKLAKKHGVVGYIETRKLEFQKASEFAQILKRNEGKAKAAGVIGELEIMEAYIHSRLRTLNLQHKLSGHSIAWMHFLDPSVPYYVTTIHNAEAQSCQKVKTDVYNCKVSMSQTMEYSSLFKNQKKTLRDIVLGRIDTPNMDVQFVRKSGVWTSPTFIKMGQDAIKDLQKAGEEYQQSAEDNEVD